MNQSQFQSRRNSFQLVCLLFYCKKLKASPWVKLLMKACKIVKSKCLKNRQNYCYSKIESFFFIYIVYSLKLMISTLNSLKFMAFNSSFRVEIINFDLSMNLSITSDIFLLFCDFHKINSPKAMVKIPIIGAQLKWNEWPNVTINLFIRYSFWCVK